MKSSIWIMVLLLSAIPAMAQAPAVDSAPDLDMIASYALGDLALHADTGLPNDPVEQLKAFFVDANAPLNKTQEKALQTIVDAQISFKRSYANQPGAASTDVVRKANRAYFAQVVSVLDPDQQSIMKQYQNQQIKLRGGFEALKLTLQQAGLPLTADQQKQLESIYSDVMRERSQNASTDGKPAGKINRAQRDSLEKVGKILTPDQRKALINSSPTKG